MGVLCVWLYVMFVLVDCFDCYWLLYLYVDGFGDGCVNVYSKVVIVDDECIVIGSVNLNNCLMLFDIECCIVFVVVGDFCICVVIVVMCEWLLVEYFGMMFVVVVDVFVCGEWLNVVFDWLCVKFGCMLCMFDLVVLL